MRTSVAYFPQQQVPNLRAGLLACGAIPHNLYAGLLSMLYAKAAKHISILFSWSFSFRNPIHQYIFSNPNRTQFRFKQLLIIQIPALFICSSCNFTFRCSSQAIYSNDGSSVFLSRSPFILFPWWKRYLFPVSFYYSLLRQPLWHLGLLSNIWGIAQYQSGPPPYQNM